jgi:hypothetical protein
VSLVPSTARERGFRSALPLCAMPSDGYGLDGRDESQPLMVREVALLADRSLTPDP